MSESLAETIESQLVNIRIQKMFSISIHISRRLIDNSVVCLNGLQECFQLTISAISLRKERLSKEEMDYFDRFEVFKREIV